MPWRFWEKLYSPFLQRAVAPAGGVSEAYGRHTRLPSTLTYVPSGQSVLAAGADVIGGRVVATAAAVVGVTTRAAVVAGAAVVVVVDVDVVVEVDVDVVVSTTVSTGGGTVVSRGTVVAVPTASTWVGNGSAMPVGFVAAPTRISTPT